MCEDDVDVHKRRNNKAGRERENEKTLGRWVNEMVDDGGNSLFLCLVNNPTG
jgi:hypothetical protein